MSAVAKRMAATGLVTGFVAGFALWSRQQRVDRRSLFHGNPVRRLAAFGYLRGRVDAQTAALLREYVKWERRPDLRRRAQGLLLRVERTLD